MGSQLVRCGAAPPPLVADLCACMRVCADPGVCVARVCVQSFSSRLRVCAAPPFLDTHTHTHTHTQVRGRRGSGSGEGAGCRSVGGGRQLRRRRLELGPHRLGPASPYGHAAGPGAPHPLYPVRLARFRSRRPDYCWSALPGPGHAARSTAGPSHTVQVTLPVQVPRAPDETASPLARLRVPRLLTRPGAPLDETGSPP